MLYRLNRNEPGNQQSEERIHLGDDKHSCHRHHDLVNDRPKKVQILKAPQTFPGSHPDSCFAQIQICIRLD